MQPRSSTLFHFTQDLITLKKILLNSGFWPKYCREDVKWQGRQKYEYVAFPMVCFCDIPLSRLKEHVALYGNFGLGMSKDWAIKNHVNPVFYFTGDNPVHGALKSLTEGILELDPEKRSRGYQDVRYILAHSKPTEGTMPRKGDQKIQFYQESEWRHVPRHNDINDYLNSIEIENKETAEAHNKKTFESCLLKFTPSDIRYVFVPKDTDIPSVVEFIKESFKDKDPFEVDILLSRITSLEHIALDA